MFWQLSILLFLFWLFRLIISFWALVTLSPFDHSALSWNLSMKTPLSSTPQKSSCISLIIPILKSLPKRIFTLPHPGKNITDLSFHFLISAKIKCSPLIKINLKSTFRVRLREKQKKLSNSTSFKKVQTTNHKLGVSTGRQITITSLSKS